MKTLFYWLLVALLAAGLFVVSILYYNVEPRWRPASFVLSRDRQWVLSGDQHLFDVTERAFDVRRLDGFAEGRLKHLPLGARRSPYQPHFVPASGNATIGAGELVLGVVNGATRSAYPLRVLAVHQAVDDSTQSPPVVVYFGINSGSAAAYSAVLDGGELQLAPTGFVYVGADLLHDLKSESLFLPVTGTFVSGDLVGKRLELLPAAVTTLEQWLALFPDSRIMTTNTGFAAKDYVPVDPYGKGRTRPAGDTRSPLTTSPDCVALFTDNRRWEALLLELPPAADWGKTSQGIDSERLSCHATLESTVGGAFVVGADGALLPAVRAPLVTMVELIPAGQVVRVK